MREENGGAGLFLEAFGSLRQACALQAGGDPC